MNTERRACTKCDQEFPLDAYGKRKDRRWGYNSWCNKCRAEYSREWKKNQRKTNLVEYRQKERDTNLKKLYGISTKKYDKLLELQGGKCRICNGPPNGKGRFHVDHNHQTGVIRGLLCHSCNTGLGAFGDNIRKLKAAIQYLRGGC